MKKKAGRKRKMVAVREPNGRPSRNIPAEARGNHPAAVARFVRDALLSVSDKRYGTPLGRLFLAHKISSTEYAAGKKWDEKIAQYRAATGGPSDPRSIVIGEGSGGAAPDPDSDAGRKQARRETALIAEVHQAEAEVLRLGSLVLRDMRRLCEGEGELPAGLEALIRVKRGLNALAAFWAMDKPERL